RGGRGSRRGGGSDGQRRGGGDPRGEVPAIERHVCLRSGRMFAPSEATVDSRQLQSRRPGKSAARNPSDSAAAFRTVDAQPVDSGLSTVDCRLSTPQGASGWRRPNSASAPSLDTTTPRRASWYETV